jgi:hypothetical protein
MGAPNGTRSSEITRSLSRAIAARGGLDDVYRSLSDHWTLLMQELYPVWLVLGPGLSNPGEIDLRSRTVYLDSELIGTRSEIVEGKLDRYQVVVCFGVAFHEVGHAKHTKTWVDTYEKKLAEAGRDVLVADRRLLEEPRMEAHTVRDHGERTARGRFIRRSLTACATSVLLGSVINQIAMLGLAGQPVTRDVCGKSMIALAARTHYGVIDPSTLEDLNTLWEAVLGADDVTALHELFARLILIVDGDLEALDKIAVEYRKLIGPPDPPPPSPASGGGTAGHSAAAQAGSGAPEDGASEAGESGAEGSDGGEPGSDAQAPGSAGASGAEPQNRDGSSSDGEQTGARPTFGSLGEALEVAGEQARANQLQQLNEEAVLSEVLARAQGQPDPASGGHGTGAPTGRMPKRGVDRPPCPDEVRAAIQFANRLEQARTQSLKQISKRTPGGRFHPRNHLRAMAQRQHGQPVTAHAWSLERVMRNPIRGPHVIFIVDTSGSMEIYEYALGPIVWIIDTGLRMVGGRMATGLFGNSAELLSDGRSPLRLVPAIRTGGGTAFAGDAMVMCADELEMENFQRPRLAYILSDGGWYDTEAGVTKIEWLAALGVPTIHIALLHEPLSVLAARISVISDPADALTVVAEDTVAALRTPPRTLPARAASHT